MDLENIGYRWWQHGYWFNPLSELCSFWLPLVPLPSMVVRLSWPTCISLSKTLITSNRNWWTWSFSSTGLFSDKQGRKVQRNDGPSLWLQGWTWARLQTHAKNGQKLTVVNRHLVIQHGGQRQLHMLLVTSLLACLQFEKLVCPNHTGPLYLDWLYLSIIVKGTNMKWLAHSHAVGQW